MIKIRKFKKKDAKICSKIIAETVKKENIIVKKSQEEVIKASTPEALIERMKTRKYFVCKKNNKILGIGALNKNQVRTMYVLSNHQKGGIGTLILKRIEKEALKNKTKKLFLYTHPKPAKFYLKNGFKTIKKLKYRGDPVIYMEKNLKCKF